MPPTWRQTVVGAPLSLPPPNNPSEPSPLDASDFLQGPPQPQADIFLTTTTDSGVIATSGADQLDLPFLAAINRPRRHHRRQPLWASYLDYAAASSTPRTKFNSPPRAPSSSSTIHAYGLLQHQRRRLQVRCGTCTFRRRVRDRQLLRPNNMHCCSLVFCRHQRLYCPRIPHRRRFALWPPQHSHSRPPIAFYRTICRHQRSYHICDYYDVTAFRLERCTALFKDHPSRFHRTFLQDPTPSGSSTTLALSRSSSGVHTARLHRTPATDPRACNTTRQGA